MAKQQNIACVAAMGTMTMAVKAQRALLSAGIHAEVVALSPKETRRGCAYGVEYPCGSEAQVRSALRAVGLSPSQYLERTPTRDLS